MKQFDLNEYLKNPSQKVVTRDGRAVRIICTDAKGDEPIIALVYNKNRDEENVYTYNRYGSFLGDNYDCLDLFFAPIKREGWTNIYKDKDGGVYLSGLIFKNEKEAKEAVNGNNHYVTSLKIEWEE